jgi:hypothetical protein
LRPFTLLDHIDVIAEKAVSALSVPQEKLESVLDAVIEMQFGKIIPPGVEKLRRNSRAILVGLLVGVRTNARLAPPRLSHSPRASKMLSGKR